MVIACYPWYAFPSGTMGTSKNTIIHGESVSVDLERGGSGLINIHVKVGNTKYFLQNDGSLLSQNGVIINSKIASNPKIQRAIKKASDLVIRGGGNDFQ